MANGNSSGFTQAIRVLFEVGTLEGLTDGQLLEQFARARSPRPPSRRWWRDTDPWS